GTAPSAIRSASPSTIAVFPTPDLPISTGLFFVLRPRIWMSRASSESRPITGSSCPRRAASVRSRPYRQLSGPLSLLSADRDWAFIFRPRAIDPPALRIAHPGLAHGPLMYRSGETADGDHARGARRGRRVMTGRTDPGPFGSK